MYNLKGDWNDVYKSILSIIQKEGEVIRKSRAIYNLSFQINPNQSLILPKKNWTWAFVELFDRLNPFYKNPGYSYKFRPHWKKKLEKEDGHFVYNYHDRIGSQLTSIFDQLSSSRNSSQAVLTIYNDSDLLDYKKLKRVPCTIALHFFVSKDRKLHLTVFMRTNDVINLLVYDVFHHSILQKFIASRLGLEVGNYTHYTSIAYYQKKRDVTGYIDRFLDKKIELYSFYTNFDFHRELMHSIVSPLNINNNYSNSFVSDFNKVIKNKLYNKQIKEFSLEFFKKI